MWDAALLFSLWDKFLLDKPLPVDKRGFFVDTGGGTRPAQRRRPARGSDVPPARHSLPLARESRSNGQKKRGDKPLSSFGALGRFKSEPRVKFAWEERERGRESSFAFERSGSFRAAGAAPESGHPRPIRPP